MLLIQMLKKLWNILQVPYSLKFESLFFSFIKKLKGLEIKLLLGSLLLIMREMYQTRQKSLELWDLNKNWDSNKKFLFINYTLLIYELNA